MQRDSSTRSRRCRTRCSSCAARRRVRPTTAMRELYLRAPRSAWSRFLTQRSCFSTLRLPYAGVLANPAAEAVRLNEFLGGHLDRCRRMAQVAEPRLYRNRGDAGGEILRFETTPSFLNLFAALSNRSPNSANAGVGPFHRSSSTMSNSGSRSAGWRGRETGAPARARAAAWRPGPRAWPRSRPTCASPRESLRGARTSPAPPPPTSRPSPARPGIAVRRNRRPARGSRGSTPAARRTSRSRRPRRDGARAGDPTARRACRARTAPGPCRACRSRTRSTRGSAAAFAAAAASASSASYSTIGQTTTPSAVSASSSSGNCASRSGSMPCAGLVARPQLVAERLDDVIGRDADVRGPRRHHAEQRRDHAAHGPDFAAVAHRGRGHREVVPEQLVGAVDQIDVHIRSSHTVSSPARSWAPPGSDNVIPPGTSACCWRQSRTGSGTDRTTAGRLAGRVRAAAPHQVSACHNPQSHTIGRNTYNPNGGMGTRWTRPLYPLS